MLSFGLVKIAKVKIRIRSIQVEKIIKKQMDEGRNNDFGEFMSIECQLQIYIKPQSIHEFSKIVTYTISTNSK